MRFGFPTPTFTEKPGKEKGSRVRLYRFTTKCGIKYAAHVYLRFDATKDEEDRRHNGAIIFIQKMWLEDVRGGNTDEQWRTGKAGKAVQ